MCHTTRGGDIPMEGVIYPSGGGDLVIYLTKTPLLGLLLEPKRQTAK